MKRALIICLFLLLSETTGMCANISFPPLQPIDGQNGLRNYSNNDIANNVTTLPDQFATPMSKETHPDITKIEQILFGHTYPTQNISMRLSRIEKSLFSKTYSSASDAQRIDNIISNFNQINKHPNISQNGLTKIEKQIFNQSFTQNNPQRRIERLEEQLLGAVQSGELDARYETLKIAAKAYKQNNNDNNTDDFYTSSNRGWKGITNGLGNSILGGGSMTGFTPPISPFYNNYNSGLLNRNRGFNNGGLLNPNRYNYSNPYMRAYGNPYMPTYNGYSSPYSSNAFQMGGYGTNQGVRTNHGYYDGASNCGSGASVTILD